MQIFMQWKEIRITYSECVCLALVTQHAMRLHHTVICGLSGCTLFFHICHEWQDFRKISLWIQNVFWFSLQHFIPRRTERYMIKMYIGRHVQYSSFLSDFNETWILSTDFRKILKYQILWHHGEANNPLHNVARLSKMEWKS